MRKDEAMMQESKSEEKKLQVAVSLTYKGDNMMTGARILLVEDDAILSTLICRNLQARHHEVMVANDSISALELLRTHQFDLVFLDINLPDETGWWMLNKAQQEGYLCVQKIDDDHPKLPVVVLSAVRVKAAQLARFQPLAYLSKPFPMDALLRLALEAAQRRAAPLPD
jgi:CheY-like chemotaxis protein